VLQTHGSPIRRCRELSFVGHITSVGIRSARRKPYQDSQDHGSLIITTNRFRTLGPEGVADLIPPAENLYITLDIDVMDPSQAPATGTPEPGGLTSRELLDTLRHLAEELPIVGADIVEVSPPYDGPGEVTAYLANRCVLEILNGMAQRKLGA